MKTFRYVRPEDLTEAFAVLEEHGADARVLSGGTDLFVGLRQGKVRAGVVVDLKRVPDIPRGVRDTGAALEVGAMTVLTDLIDDERVRRAFPALIEAAVTVGSIQIRNRATLAGNICNASPAADTVLPLLIHGAQVRLAGREGTRRVAVKDFILGPGRTGLRRGEIVTSIVLPHPGVPAGAAFARMTRRRGVDLATVNVCCSVAASGETRFAFGAAAPRPVLVRDETGRLCDAALEPDERDRLLGALTGRTAPISDVRGSEEYRRAMLLVLAGRTLRTSLSRLARLERGGPA